MAQILQFQSERRDKAERATRVEEALRHIRAAADLLADSAGEEEKIGWLLEDCADLLHQADRRHHPGVQRAQS